MEELEGVHLWNLLQNDDVSYLGIVKSEVIDTEVTEGYFFYGTFTESTNSTS